MERIDRLFVVHRAKSEVARHYRPGDVAFVGNGLKNNAVARFVSPLPGDTIFRFRGITVSAFCEATVQAPPFVGCGRAGNGMLALEPRAQMSASQLATIAAYINTAVRWRFNWYRQVTADRLGYVAVPSDPVPGVSFPVKDYLPKAGRAKKVDWSTLPPLTLRGFALGDLFDLKPGDYHSVSALPRGKTPVVSCGDRENGITSYRGVTAPVYRGALTIAFNGMNTLNAKYHPYTFAAKDDVAVCQPKKKLRFTTLLFIPVMLGREKWRYSYYRKCFIEKLKRFEIPLPAKNGEVDEDTIQTIMESSASWATLRAQLS